MEYRDQLNYIKSHRYDEEDRRKKGDRKRRKKQKKISVFDKFLWMVLFVLSVLFIALMYLSEIFPVPYLIGVGGILLAFLMIIKIKQQRARKLAGIKRVSKGRVLALLLSTVLVLGGFYFIKILIAMDEIAIGEESGEYTEEHLINVEEKPFNIYISGIDVYGEITKESRSDVNLVVTVNPKTHKILITTTPRDYYVTIPGVSGDYRDKLTHAGIYGIDTSMDTLENLYSTEIPFYARVNFSSVIEIVDAMGGIDVDSEVAFTTSKAAGTVVDIKEGKNHLNGKQALAFVRERKAFLSGDNQRGRNQQILLEALIKKMISPKFIIQANDVIDRVVGNAETNMSETQMKKLIRMQLNDLEGWEIESIAATGDDSGKQYCYSYSAAPLYVCVPDAAVVEEISQKMEEYLSY